MLSEKKSFSITALNITYYISFKNFNADKIWEQDTHGMGNDGRKKGA